MAILEAQRSNSELRCIPYGADGTRATLNAMVELVKQYRVDPNIRALAERIIHDVPGKNYVGEARAVHAWVQRNIRYTMDVFDVETLKNPLWIVESGQGDCDDHALLVCTLLQSIGHPCRFIAVGYSGNNQFDHVYAETKIGPRWIAMETTEPVDFGVRPPRALNVMIAHV
jgi:transglutaminase-like putative cysteine protease